MTREEFANIESSRFSAMANIASDTRVLSKIIRKSPDFTGLLKASQINPAIAEAVVRRVNELCTAPFDKKYLNDADIAVATYFLLIHDTDLRRAADLAGQLPPRNWHWADMIAKTILAIPVVRPFAKWTADSRYDVLVANPPFKVNTQGTGARSRDTDNRFFVTDVKIQLPSLDPKTSASNLIWTKEMMS
jgi:hypothetical protein